MTAAPEQGARFELLHEPEAGGRYAISVHAPDGVFAASASIDTAGVALHWEAAPPGWMHETTLGFLRMLQKNHAGDGEWPSRLVRWRTERNA